MEKETIGTLRWTATGLELHLPPGSAQGVRVQIRQVSQGELLRTVNGELVDLTRPLLRKFGISMSCDAQLLPDLSGVWQGSRLTVSPPIWWHKHAPSGLTVVHLDRPAEPSTLRVVTEDFEADVSGAVLSEDGMTVTIPASQSGRVVQYQPIFVCLALDCSQTSDEWSGAAGWALELEEV